MSFQSLNHVLGDLEQQDQWRSRQQFRQLISHWPQLVGELVAAQTRPLGIQRSVLSVATSSAAWAQNLIFERLRLVQKINQQLGLDLTDIRFSTAQWSTKPVNAGAEAEPFQLWEDHPSRLPDSPSRPTQPDPSQRLPASPGLPYPATPEEAQQAFQRWAETMRSRSRQLPLCPQCQCPTPPGELNRWSTCALCAAKGWKS